MKTRFHVHEIEHGEDETKSLADLVKAGCTEIRVLSRDYEDSECIVVECELPAGVARPIDLKLEFACL